MNLNDSAPEPLVDIYWCQQAGQTVNEDCFFFFFLFGTLLEGEKKYNYVCCVLGTVLGVYVHLSMYLYLILVPTL